MVDIEQKQIQRFTYADYLTWDDDKRWELIDGVPYLMACPTNKHQDLLLGLASQLRSYLKGKRCKVFMAPSDVRLNFDSDDDTVVQPDVYVVCNRDKLDERGIKGAPDFAIEILSPSSLKMDKIIKYEKYLQAGVREYWIVDPEARVVHVHVLLGDKYTSTSYTDKDTAVPVMVLDGLTIDLADVFAEMDNY